MRFLLLIILSSAFSFELIGQDNRIIISGLVLDSASLQPLSYTAIQVKRNNEGQTTREDGSFSIGCLKTDTLVFSRLGHKPFVLPVRLANAPVKIFLAEDATLLKEVTVYDRLNIQGMNESKEELPSGGKIKLKEQPLEPTQNEVATFGPGITFKLGGKDNTTAKREELSKTELYRTTINSPEVKKDLMNLYQLSEDTYYKKLEQFNIAHPEAAYLTSKDEIIRMLTQYFAMK